MNDHLNNEFKSILNTWHDLLREDAKRFIEREARRAVARENKVLVERAELIANKIGRE